MSKARRPSQGLKKSWMTSLLLLGMLAVFCWQPSPARAAPMGHRVMKSQPSAQFCGGLIPVLQHYGYYAQEINHALYLGTAATGYTLPAARPVDPASLLVRIPLPAEDPQHVLSYDPKTQQVCAREGDTGKLALLQVLQRQEFGSVPTTQTTPQPGSPDGSTSSSTTGNPFDPWSMLTSLWDHIWQGAVEMFHQFLDWASSFGFLWITPAVLSYRNPVVLSGANWTLGAMDGFVVFLLVVNAYHSLVGYYLGVSVATMMQGLLRAVIAAVAANLGFFVVLPQVVELSNAMSVGMLGALMHASFGDMSLPLGALNWVSLPESFGVFILVDILGSFFLILVDAVRLAVFDLTILLAPWGILAFASEYTRNFGRFWASLFFCSLFVQPLQTGVMALGGALIGNWGHFNPNDPAICQRLTGAAQQSCLANLGHANLSGSTTIVALLVGIACLYVACKLPQMLWSNALRVSAGSINRDTIAVALNAISFGQWEKQTGQ